MSNSCHALTQNWIKCKVNHTNRIHRHHGKHSIHRSVESWWCLRMQGQHLSGIFQSALQHVTVHLDIAGQQTAVSVNQTADNVHTAFFHLAKTRFWAESVTCLQDKLATKICCRPAGFVSMLRQCVRHTTFFWLATTLENFLRRTSPTNRSNRKMLKKCHFPSYIDFATPAKQKK